MDETKKHIDELVATRNQKQAELLTMGREIASSALLLPLNNLELVKVLEKGQRLRARGIIHDIYVGVITLNYVDIETVAESGGA